MKVNDINVNSIINENIKKGKYKNMKDNDKTIAQFQFNHCRYCKNKNTNLCEIRRNLDNKFVCVHEVNMYEKSNIK